MDTIMLDISAAQEDLVTEGVSILEDNAILFNGSLDTQDDELMPYQLRTALLVVISATFIIGVTGNLLAISVFLSTKALRTAPNYLIVNLSISDLMMLTANAPVMLVSVFHGSWPFEQTGCAIYAFCGAIASFASIGSMAAISIDRYYVICHCFHALINLSLRRTLAIIFLVWVYASMWSIPPFVGIGAYVEEGYGIGCTFDYISRDLNTTIYIALIYVGGFLIPVSVIAVCYTKIYRAVIQHRKEIGRFSRMKEKYVHGRARRTSKFSRLMGHYQLVKVGVIVTVLFCISWGPYAIVALYSQFATNQEPIGPIVQIVPVVFAKMSSIWNPIVYAVSHRRFKKALFHMLGSIFPRMESKQMQVNTESQDHERSIVTSSRFHHLGNATKDVARMALESGQGSDNLPIQVRKQSIPAYMHYSDSSITRACRQAVVLGGSDITSDKSDTVSVRACELGTTSGVPSTRNILHIETWYHHGNNRRDVVYV